jgi:ComF family protein
MECRKKTNSAFDTILAMYPYQGEWKELIYRYKFEGARYTIPFLVKQLLIGGAWLQKRCGPFDGWVPVPPRKGKIKEKGWDQIDLLARFLQKTQNIPVVRCLQREQSKVQKQLNQAERVTNLQGKIHCINTPPSRVLLFDDILTTGATLDVCAKELKRAGCQSVAALTLFYD